MIQLVKSIVLLFIVFIAPITSAVTVQIEGSFPLGDIVPLAPSCFESLQPTSGDPNDNQIRYGNPVIGGVAQGCAAPAEQKSGMGHLGGGSRV